PRTGDDSTFSGTYTIQQSDIDNSGVTNQATATGTTPNDGDITDLSDDPSDLTNQDINGNGNPDDPTITTFNTIDSISLIKTGNFNDESGDGFAQVGETISYTFRVRNSGNRTLTNVRITDPLLVLPNGSLVGGQIATLPPGPSGVDSTTFTGTYTIQQSDIDAGTVRNQALATGTSPDG
ncbi:DUF7507 domain-containing protein, partial [Nonlabens antarcticus]